MKNMTTTSFHRKDSDLIALAIITIIAFVFLIGAAFYATAQDRQGPPQGGPPSASEMAEHLISEFDGDGNGELSLTELTAALEALHQRRPQGPPPGAQGGQGSRPR